MIDLLLRRTRVTPTIYTGVVQARINMGWASAVFFLQNVDGLKKGRPTLTSLLNFHFYEGQIFIFMRGCFMLNGILVLVLIFYKN